MKNVFQQQAIICLILYKYIYYRQYIAYKYLIYISFSSILVVITVIILLGKVFKVYVQQN